MEEKSIDIAIENLLNDDFSGPYMTFKDVFKCYKCGEFLIKKVAYIDVNGYLCEECAWK